MIIDFSDAHLPRQPAIDKESVRNVAREGGAHRIHFETTHSTALKKSPGDGKDPRLTLPFNETIGPILWNSTGLELRTSVFQGYWLPLKSDEEYASVKGWIEEQGSLVFIKNKLALSVALDLNIREDQGYTEIGHFEHLAKEQSDQNALEKLNQKVCETIRRLPFYSDTNLVSAVPPRPTKSYDLPSTLAEMVGEECGLTNISGEFTWGSDKGQLKDAEFEEKWDQLEFANLQINALEEKQESIILLDDLYQSGTTMHYVAMKLLNAGVKRVYGLALVKSWSDTDNK